MEYLTIHFKLKHQSWPGDGSIKVELFSDHIVQPEGLLVTNSRFLLFFITMSIKRSWLQNKNKFNSLKVFWESTFKVTYFLKRFLHGLFVLGPLPTGSETSFWCTFSAFINHINIAYLTLYDAMLDFCSKIFNSHFLSLVTL